MPSVIPGYEYDVFISYRQKDNKYDGWVTEFAANLNKELEATFKEEISVYFDANPHDGLLETHDVNKSLLTKIKCLVFIPIISQTYCDPNSFAWQQELIPFNDFASSDKFGREIKLPGGNYTSRILPIRIHELDSPDIQTLENVFPKGLRSVDFIYQSPGVNRPLRSRDDDHHIQTSQLLYRDQINKTANVIKEIIHALKAEPIPQHDKTILEKPSRKIITRKAYLRWLTSEVKKRQVFRAGFAYLLTGAIVYQIFQLLTPILDLSEGTSGIIFWIVIIGFFPAILLAWYFELSPKGLVLISSVKAKENPYTPSQRKPFTSTVVIGVLILLLMLQFLYFNWQKSTPAQNIEKSIAILPFENRGDSTTLYLSEGLTDDINAQLSKIGEFRLLATAAGRVFGNSNQPYNKIAEELGVSYLLIGSIQKSGNTIRISPKLVDKTNRYVWAETFNSGSSKDIFATQLEIAMKIAEVLKVKITETEQGNLRKKPTENLTAYDYYLKGRSYYLKYQRVDNELAIDQFKKAIALDSNYALAWAGLGDAYGQLPRFGSGTHWGDSALVVSLKAVQLDSSLSESYKALGSSYYVVKQYDQSIQAMKKAIDLNPYNVAAIGNLGTNYFVTGNYVDALKWQKKSAALNPKGGIPYQLIGWIYRYLGDLSKAENWLTKSLELQPIMHDTFESLAYVYVCQGRKKEALELIPKLLELGPDDSRIQEIAGLISHFAGNETQAKNHFIKSLELNNEAVYDPEYVAAIHLGQILLNEGNEIEASIYLDNALDINLKEVQNGSQDDAPPFHIAGIYSIKGNRNQALHWLKKAIDSNWVDYVQVTHGPWFVAYQKDPEFVALMKSLKHRMDSILKESEKAN